MPIFPAGHRRPGWYGPVSAQIVAQKIREVAQAHGVPVIENKPLAWALYEGVEVGEEISEELYRGVAEILAMVYRLRAG